MSSNDHSNQLPFFLSLRQTKKKKKRKKARETTLTCLSISVVHVPQKEERKLVPRSLQFLVMVPVTSSICEKGTCFHYYIQKTELIVTYTLHLFFDDYHIQLDQTKLFCCFVSIPSNDNIQI